MQLKLSDFDKSSQTLKILGKRNKERIIPLLNSVVNSMNAYLECRQKLENISAQDHIFLTLKGDKIYETLVYRIINNYFSIHLNNTLYEMN